MSFVKGLIFIFAVIINTVFWVPILLLFSLIKLLVPFAVINNYLSQFLIWIANNWILLNTYIHHILYGNKTEVIGLEDLDINDWYLVISNHCSAADIPILQSIFRNKIPFLKFFLKKELIYVPLLGLAWWALDFPFMRRFSAEYLAKNPHMKGRDLEVTKKACEKFKDYPISVINFVEGTRFTQIKHAKQHSKFKHLLKPKSGGIGFVLGSMGEQMTYLIQVSIKYSPKAPSAWEYMSGNYDKVVVKVNKLKIPETLKGRNYITDMPFRKELQDWLNDLWLQQDERLS
jgi:1-acyl-sn-glycerol-3-phosphate acyltransferase